MKVWMLAGLGLFTFCVFAEGHFANGIKIGEVDQDSAIIWTRLAKAASINPDGVAVSECSGRFHDDDGREAE